MAVHSIYIEKDDESTAPPERVLKLTYFSGGHNIVTREPMEEVIFLAIGDFDEGTFEDSFKSSEDRQFSVRVEDLMRGLIGLGVIDTTRKINPNPEPRSAA
jgi:hypothetical protein